MKKLNIITAIVIIFSLLAFVYSGLIIFPYVTINNIDKAFIFLWFICLLLFIFNLLNIFYFNNLFKSKKTAYPELAERVARLEGTISCAIIFIVAILAWFATRILK